MTGFLAKLFPPQADNTLPGSRLPVVFFGAYTLVSLARSLIHLLAPDGGAGSIAGMDLSDGAAQGVILAFGLWGSAQLITALTQLVVLLRYRSLIPLMYLLLIVETLLRQLVGVIKPASFSHTPPGAALNLVVLPLAVVMLVLALWERGPSTRTAKT